MVIGKGGAVQATGYLNFAQALDLAAVLLDQNGNVLDVNPTFLRELGYAVKAVQEKTVFEINPVMSLVEWKRLRKKLASEFLLSTQSEYMTAAGNVFPVQRIAIAVQWQNKQCYCFISENLLEKNRFPNLLRHTSEVSRIGSWEWDILHNRFYANDVFYELLQLPKSDESDIKDLAKVVEERIPASYREQIKRKWAEAIQHGKNYELEVPIQVDAGEPTVFKISTHVLLSEERAVRAYGTIQDFSAIAQRSEEMYLAKFSVENANHMIFWVDSDGSFFYVNDAVCEQLGYTKKDFLEMKVEDVEPSFANINWSDHWQELQEKKTMVFETELQASSGDRIPVFMTLNYLQYQGKGYNCAFANNRSFLDEQNRQQLLASFSVEHSNDMIFWVNPKAEIIYANTTATENLGYSREELLNMRSTDLSLNTDEEEWPERWEELKEKAPLPGYESEQHRKDGTVMPVEISKYFIRFQDEVILCALARDITQRKAREAKLKNSLEKIEKLSQSLEEEKTYLEQEIELYDNFNEIISQNANYKKVLKKVEQVADTEATVLITGETGTGKELLARVTHKLSNRHQRPMVKVNCATLPANLIESTLFGHERGAFTGAQKRKMGRFELADKGTIFLDEIGELPLKLQVKLLRVLQEGEFTRLGSSTTLKVDVRVIAATNRNLEEMVKNGKFREDLYYRLNVFPIYNIPLRERKDDIPLLVQYFVDKKSKQANRSIKKIPDSAIKKLMQYNFPGNIRELENIIERAIILSSSDKLNLEPVLPAFSAGSSSNENALDYFPSFEEIQRKHILDALKRTDWKVTGKNSASELLQMNGKTLASKMRKLDIKREDFLDI